MIMNPILLVHRFLCVAAVGIAVAASALTPAEVQKQLAAGKPLTFVDVRSRAAFQAGHIPNAINIPAALVAQKQLPPLGNVVVYDDGLGTETATAAATALSAKPGIAAFPLEGGFAAWESAQAAASTRASGLAPDELPLITYSQLKHAETNNVVLVDLRKRPAPAPQTLSKAAAVSALTDLATEFPHAKITKSPFAAPVQRLSGGGAAASVPPLLVLIDNGDGSAQETARQLKANGVKRFAILAGGEEMIVRKGEPGLNRQGSSIVVQQSDPTATTK